MNKISNNNRMLPVKERCVYWKSCKIKGEEKMCLLNFSESNNNHLFAVFISILIRLKFPGTAPVCLHVCYGNGLHFIPSSAHILIQILWIFNEFLNFMRCARCEVEYVASRCYPFACWCIPGNNLTLKRLQSQWCWCIISSSALNEGCRDERLNLPAVEQERMLQLLLFVVNAVLATTDLMTKCHRMTAIQKHYCVAFFNWPHQPTRPHPNDINWNSVENQMSSNELKLNCMGTTMKDNNSCFTDVSSIFNNIFGHNTTQTKHIGETTHNIINIAEKKGKKNKKNYNYG